ncbi:MAG: hypothetical protein ACYTEQ_01170 [Planctomycetota bacterium]|jgi:hypothetical protein
MEDCEFANIEEARAEGEALQQILGEGWELKTVEYPPSKFFWILRKEGEISFEISGDGSRDRVILDIEGSYFFRAYGETGGNFVKFIHSLPSKLESYGNSIASLSTLFISKDLE